jgi:hypothetical protein
MPGPTPGGDKRYKKRIKKRIPCEFTHEGRRSTGIILDVSVDGLFIQTSSLLPAGTVTTVKVQATPTTPALELEARVARAKRVPPQLVTQAAGGIGLRILRAPPEFLMLQRELAQDAETSRSTPVSSAAQTPPPAAAPPKPKRRWRVRLKETTGNRSKLIEVAAESAPVARKDALRDAGEGWDVLEVEPLG